jgi:hypothetical protein
MNPISQIHIKKMTLHRNIMIFYHITGVFGGPTCDLSHREHYATANGTKHCDIGIIKITKYHD